jgi:hypothetical protein
MMPRRLRVQTLRHQPPVWKPRSRQKQKRWRDRTRLDGFLVEYFGHDLSRFGCCFSDGCICAFDIRGEARSTLDKLLSTHVSNHYTSGVAAVYVLPDPAFPPESESEPEPEPAAPAVAVDVVEEALASRGVCRASSGRIRSRRRRARCKSCWIRSVRRSGGI